MAEKNRESPPTQEEMEEMRKRVDDLARPDDKYRGEDPIYDLALIEKEHREKKKPVLEKKIEEKLEEMGLKNVKIELTQEDVGEMSGADEVSTEALGRMEAEKEKWIDGLTGLRNRKAYDAEVPQSLSSEIRHGRNGAFIEVDMDHFKGINDTYGHDVGDKALKEMAKILRATVRTSDAVYRFGGEEFVVFFPETKSAEALLVAEKIRAAASKDKIKVKIKVKDAKGKDTEEEMEIEISMSVSVGCVGTDQLKEWKDIKPWEEVENSGKFKDQDEYYASLAAAFTPKMFKLADDAMYKSKHNGRNQVTLYKEDMSKE